MSVLRRLGTTTEAPTQALDLLDLLLVSGNRSQLSETLREVAYVLARAGDEQTALLALLGREGLPVMPRGSAELPSDDELRDQLSRAAGENLGRLRLQAAAMPEHELIACCQRALTALLAAPQGAVAPVGEAGG